MLIRAGYLPFRGTKKQCAKGPERGDRVMASGLSGSAMIRVQTFHRENRLDRSLSLSYARAVGFHLE